MKTENEHKRNWTTKLITWLCTPSKLIVLSFGIIVFSIISPWLFATHASGLIEFGEKTGQIGDTFGVMNPIVAIAAAIITFAAFYMQWLANEKVNKQENHRQINDLASQHWILINSVKLYEGNIQESLNFSVAADEKMVLSSKTRHNENILREGCEALYTLYAQMYLHWVLNLFFDAILANKDFVDIDFAGAQRRIDKKNKGDYVQLLISNRYNAEDIEMKIFDKYLSEENKNIISKEALNRLITYYGYLFLHLFDHMFFVLEQIDSNKILNEQEKKVKGQNFVGMLPAFEKIIVFLMFEFNVESFIESSRKKRILQIMRKYGFFEILVVTDFMMKEEFLRHRDYYVEE